MVDRIRFLACWVSASVRMVAGALFLPLLPLRARDAFSCSSELIDFVRQLSLKMRQLTINFGVISHKNVFELFAVFHTWVKGGCGGVIAGYTGLPLSSNHRSLF